MTTVTAARGGGWLLAVSTPNETFTPERLTEDHRLIAQTTDEFATGEVLPALERLEEKDWDLARALLRRCGELGLLGVNVPETYGGVELDKVASLIVSERVARSASFGATPPDHLLPSPHVPPPSNAQETPGTCVTCAQLVSTRSSSTCTDGTVAAC